MRVDHVIIVDWSSAGMPKTGRDSIWIGTADRSGTTAENIPTRVQAEQRLNNICANVPANERVLIGVDFGLGYPRGFAQRVTGQASAFALWRWLAERVTDTPENVSNYRVVAASLNAASGGGPFWGDARAQDTAGLPRRKPPLPDGIAAHRITETAGRDGGAVPKTMWQLAYAGAVGAQSLTGIPMMHRLRSTFTQSRVWPFEPMDAAPIVFAEVYPSLIARTAEAEGFATKDAAQVTLLARALFRLGQSGLLADLFDVDQPPELLVEEGWILGAGHAETLRAALG